MTGRLPWFRFRPAEFFERTKRLKPNETGVLIALECEIYAEGGQIEDDPKRLAFICRTQKGTLASILDRLIATGKIERHGGFLTSPVITGELEWQAKKSEKYAENGRRRWKKPNENNAASEQLHSHPDTRALDGEPLAPPARGALHQTEGGRALERAPSTNPVTSKDPFAPFAPGAEVNLPGIGLCEVEDVRAGGWHHVRSPETGEEYEARLIEGRWAEIEPALDDAGGVSWDDEEVDDVA